MLCQSLGRNQWIYSMPVYLWCSKLTGKILRYLARYFVVALLVKDYLLMEKIILVSTLLKGFSNYFVRRSIFTFLWTLLTLVPRVISLLLISFIDAKKIIGYIDHHDDNNLETFSQICIYFICFFNYVDFVLLGRYFVALWQLEGGELLFQKYFSLTQKPSCFLRKHGTIIRAGMNM